jgi:hypothetical protein
LSDSDSRRDQDANLAPAPPKSKLEPRFGQHTPDEDKIKQGVHFQSPSLKT